MKKIKHLIEAGLLHLLFTAFRTLPLDAASYVGGFMARSAGPFMSAHKTAQRNLAMAFPGLTSEQQRAILSDMWDNLGRVAAELPHLPGTALLSRIVSNGVENYPAAGTTALFFSGHLGCWELLPAIARRDGTPVAMAYRKANNPYVDKMIADLRARHASGMFPKGPHGAVKLVRLLKGGQSLSMLVDQKMNDGIAAPFFGRDAMTAPAIAQMALRYDMPIIPARVIRTKGAHFKGMIYPALQYEKTGDEEKDILAIMTAINAMLEAWIREYPAQWFWVHKRWPNE